MVKVGKIEGHKIKGRLSQERRDRHWECMVLEVGSLDPQSSTHFLYHIYCKQLQTEVSVLLGFIITAKLTTSSVT